MKQFACGSVVTGCKAVFRAPNENEILTQVVRHGRHDHDLTEITDELLSAIRRNTTTIAA